jgi:transcriptional regulator with XRE-family HTH domain
MTNRVLRDDDYSALMGQRVRHLRTQRKLTLRNIVVRVGVSYQQIQKYESGGNEMSVPAMRKIAAALEVNPCEICGCCDETN